MHLSSSSAAGVRFLTSVREGRGLSRSAREAGIGKETGYRWLREAYVAHRRGGKSIAETEAVMGLASAKSIAWEAEVAAGPGRHHLRVAVDREARFWAVYDAGTGADAAASAAGVGRSTTYRWLDRRFFELRATGFTVKGAQRLLRLTDQVTSRAERLRAAAKLRERQAAAAALGGPTVLAAVRRSHRRAVDEAAAACGAGRHVLAADEVRGNQHQRLQSPGHEPTQRDDYSTSAPLPDPRPGATSGVVGALPRCSGTVADRRPAPAGLLGASDRRRAGPASVHDQTRAGSAPIP